jgi:hypothetical protein
VLLVPTRQKSAADDYRFMTRVGTAESGTFSASSFRSKTKSGSVAGSYKSSGGRSASGGISGPPSSRGMRDRTNSHDDRLSDYTADDRPTSHQSSRAGGGGGEKTEQYRRMQVLIIT